MQRLRTLHHALSPKLNRFVNICIIAALLAAACSSLQPPARARAQGTETCTASMDGAWESEFLWLCDGISTVPNSTTNVVIPTGVTITAADPTGVLPEFTAYDLTVEQNAFLRVQDNGEMQILGKIDLYGSLNISSGGTLAAVNPAAVTSLYGSSTLSLTGGSTLTTAGEMIVLDGGMHGLSDSSLLSTAGGLNLQGRLDVNASTLTVGDSAPLTVNPTGILVIDTGSTLESTGDLVVNGELDVNPGATVNLGGDLDVPGSVYASSGIFVLTSGINQTIDARSKSLSLGTLRKNASAPGETLSFTPGGSLMVNTLDLAGAEGSPLLLRSTISGSQFGLTVPSEGTQALDYVDVKDANAQPFTLYPLHWTDSGNNTNWQQGYLATTTSVTATPASATSSFGTPLTYSVEVTSASGTPAGYVTLTENGTSYGQALLDGSGAAAITTASLPVGAHTGLSAHYNGGGLFGPSQAAVVADHTVTKSTASLNLTAPASAVYGEPVTLSASVTSADGGVITGQVTFYDGAESLGPVALDESGAAVMMLTPDAGERTFTASYSGSANYTTADDTAAVSVNAPDHLFTVQAMSSDSSEGSCSEGTCTNLRAAIDAANAVVDPAATVTIVMPAGEHWMMVEPAGADDNASGDFDLTHSANLVGAGSGSTTIIGSTFVGRAFHIHGAITVNFSGMKIRSAKALPGADAPDALTDPGNGGDGGAIYNEGAGTVRLVGMDLSINSAGSGGSDQGGYGLVGGWGGRGGAVYNPAGGTLVVYGSAFISNSSGQGGGLNELPSDAEIGGAGGAGGHGGAIYNAGTLSVTASTFEGNTANSGGNGSDGSSAAGAGGPGGSGGAIYTSASATLTNSVFHMNSSGSGGEGGFVNTDQTGMSGDSGSGGAVAAASASASISGSTFDGNRGGEVLTGAQGGMGGALFAGGAGGTLTVSRSYFQNNTAAGADIYTATGWNGASGGAVAVVDSAALVVQNATFYNNWAGNGSGGQMNTGLTDRDGGSGGAIFYNSDADTSSVSYSTFFRNATGTPANAGADGQGGAIYFLNGTGTGDLALTASVLMENTLDNSGDYDECAGDPLHPITSGGYNYIVYGSTCSLSIDGTDTYHDGSPVPGDITLSAVDSFGGPTSIAAITGTGPLADQVPAGTAGCTAALKTDQRGMPRAQGGACDIGAYEFGGPVAVIKEGGDNQVRAALGTPDASGFQNLQVSVRDVLDGKLLHVDVAYQANPNGNGASIIFQGNEDPKIKYTEFGSPYFAGGDGGPNAISGAYTVTASAGAYSVDFNLTNILGTTTSLSIAPVSPATYGQPVTMTAAVSPDTATGTVRFEYSDGTLVSGCAAVPVAAGAAECTATSLAQAAITNFQARYSGDAGHAASVSSTRGYSIAAAGTTTTLSASPASPVNPNTAVTFTAAVAASAPSEAVPTGTVTFTDGGEDIAGCVALVLDGEGEAACTPDPVLASGEHTIGAAYTPANANFSASSQLDYSFTVNSGAPTTVALTSSAPAEPVVGQEVTLSYSVTGEGAPTGYVSVKLDGNEICRGTVAAGSCAYTFNDSGLFLSLIAVYEGDSNFFASMSEPLLLTVNPADTTVTIDLPEANTVFGQPVTVGAAVAVTAGTGTPAGNVIVSDGDQTCTFALPGETSCEITPAAAGSKTITATFGGNVNFNGNSDTGTHMVDPGGTTTSISADIDTASVTGQSVSVAVSVAPAAPAAGVPTGTVLVQSGAEQCTITLGTDTACSLTFATADIHSISADYTSGDTNFTGSSDTASHTVNPADTAVSVSSNPPTQGKVGASVTFTAQLAVTPPGSGTPTGTVSFFEDSVEIAGCQGAALNGSQQAECTIASLPIGAHDVTAVYTPGDANFNASSSGPYTYTVNDLPATTTDVSSIDPANPVVGQQATFNFTVTSGEGTPAGSVAVKQGETTLCSGTAAGGSCQYTFTQAGDYSLSVIYAGSVDHNPSQDDILLTVSPAAVTVGAVSGLDTASEVGQAVTVSAEIAITAPGSGTVSGVVTIDGGEDTCSYTLPGQTSCDLTFVAAGGKLVSASFNDPDGNFAAAEPGEASAHTVSPTAPAITITPDTDTAGEGDDVTFTATIEVSDSGSVIPDGDVTFYTTVQASNCGSLSLGEIEQANCAELSVQAIEPIANCELLPLDENGQATCTVSAITYGEHNIVVEYFPPAGSQDFLGSQRDDYTYSVKAASTASFTSAEPTLPVVGQLVTFRFGVTSASGTPTGTVTVMNGAETLCSATVAAGECTYAFDHAGTHNLTIHYGGSDVLASSTDDFSLTVAKASTITRLVIETTDTTEQDNTVIARVTVSPAALGSGAPTGVVVVSSGSDSCLIGLGVVGAGGVPSRTCELTFSTPGPKTVTATYLGDGDYNGSSDMHGYGRLRYYMPVMINIPD